jgi:glycosyltransferase involved in cell wall biosynthesis
MLIVTQELKALLSIDRVKVLLYGNVGPRGYRSKILLNHLRNSNCHVFQVRPSIYKSDRLKFWKYFLKLGNLATILGSIELFFKAAIADVIYLLPTNTNSIKSAIWTARFFNKPLIVEMNISLYDTFVRDRKMFPEGSIKAQAMRDKDILALTKADYIIHPSIKELNYWEKFLGIGIERQKVFISPLCHVSPTRLKRNFMQDGRLKICWWGTFIPLHGIDNILQAMKILHSQGLNFTCSLFGVDSNLFHEYAKKIQIAQIEDCVLIRKDLNFGDGSLPNYLVEHCDLALGIFGNTDKAYHAVPNKLVEALSMGIPTLTMNSPALSEFFNPKIDLWTCEPTPESIAASIRKIAGGAAEPVDWEQTRQKVLNKFSVAQYQEVVSKILAKATDKLLGQKTPDKSEVLATPQAALTQSER